MWEKCLYNLATDKYRGFIPGIIKIFLFFLSLIYGLAVRSLAFFYQLKPYRLSCKVVSVGNITLGGTGKTVLVEYIARYLKEYGYKVAVLSRGYKRVARFRRRRTRLRRALGSAEGGPAYGGHKATSFETMGDEPYMLSKNLGDIPIIIDADRVKGGRQAIEEFGVDTVILDDGFQQWRLKKDLEIVAIDATNPLGNQNLIPRGILRQPLSSLRRADIFVITKTNLNPHLSDIKDVLNRINPKALMIESIHEPQGFNEISQKIKVLNPEALKGKTVTLISGIGDPASFEEIIQNLGINIGLSFRFADHHNYTQKDLDKIISSSKEKNIDTIVTTEKDAARICNLRFQDFGLRILILCIELKITKDEERFHSRLLKLYSG
jgi:tetraacyldisaccharide 4'-kinase